MTDSMTSEGWLKKTNFIEDGKSPIQATIRLEVPPHFKIVPLPSKIISWLTSLLQRLPQKPELAEEHMRTTLGRGPATSNTATASALTGTISSTECPDSTESLSWGLFAVAIREGKNFRDRVMVPWLKRQSKVPSMQWLQPSKKMDKKTPIGTQSTLLGNFYSGN